MIILAPTTDSIYVVTTVASGDIEVHSSWVDNNAGTITPGRTNTASISTATTTTIVAAPSASTYRALKYCAIHNHHASTVSVVEVYHTDGTNPSELITTTLAPNESICFVDGRGWVRRNAQGADVTAANASGSDIQIFNGTGGTWTKPTTFNPKFVIVELFGGGGGGGAGASLATAVAAHGGAGGGGVHTLRVALQLLI